jgi:hypothetical protein
MRDQQNVAGFPCGHCYRGPTDGITQAVKDLEGRRLLQLLQGSSGGLGRDGLACRQDVRLIASFPVGILIAVLAGLKRC